MKQMKTLTINGVTYTVTDPNAVSIDDTTVGGDVWSSKNIVDKLCPAFTESGAIVVCEPVEGYPLTVTADAEATAITRCGKNLAVLRTYTNYGYYGLTSTKQSDNTILVNGTSTIAANNIYLTDYGKDTTGGVQLLLPNGTYTVKVEVVSGTITGAQCVLCKPNSSGGTEYIYVALNTAYSFSVPVKGGTAILLQFSTGGTATDAKVRVQLEVGNASTAYEPYNCETFNPGETIPTLPGVNTIFADTGIVTVSGRADPAAMNRKTEERLAALETALINT